MLSNLLARSLSFSNRSYGFVLIGAIFLSGFLSWQYQTGFRVGDGAVKQQQLADLVHNGFPDFSCRYSGAKFDPDFQFLPLDLKKGSTMTHVYNGKCYYVFPFYYTAIQYPFALLFGRFGSYLLSLLFGILTLYSLYRISLLLKLSEKARSSFLAVLLLGSAFSLFATDLSETVIAIYAVTEGIYFLLKEEDSPSFKNYLFAGLLFGFAAFFRQEVILLAAGISLVQFFRIYQKRTSVAFPFSFGLLLFVQAGINIAVVGHPLGSRGHLQSSSNYDLVAQLIYLSQLVFWGKGSLGLLGAYPALLFAIRFRPRTINSLSQILLGILVFILLSGLLTSTRFWQGVLFGPRFLMTVLPFILVYLLSVLDQNWESLSKPAKGAAILLLVYSIAGGLIFDRLYHKFTRSVVVEQAELSKFSSETVVYRKGSVFLPSDSFSTPRAVFEINGPEQFDPLLEKLYETGTHKLTIIGFKDAYPREKLVPSSEKFEIVNRDFKQSPSINMETIEIRKK
ncbi:hypothetical protein EHQ53_18065 [Leptospira langatensis]|uniref:Glycosyltransferase RgtA/B/C/D-like domain-containing protein n=2 Tax=Leptospira langatensis TaxID=2484983 RepID=A0A5F1ZRX1_9LEPT|nr:hypothetical protein EHO57_02305 [Leptospira langatensis]TGL38782.1 hypothetical protein EHQ53_18065 [Leptospira langatensis]